MSATQLPPPPGRTLPKICIDVDYYNADHKARLLQYPAHEKIKDLIRDGIAIDPDEFVVHTIFTEQKDYDNWRTFQELKQLLPDRLPEFRQYFETAETIRAKFDGRDVGNHRIEKNRCSDGHPCHERDL
jgi:hypothetical protein